LKINGKREKTAGTGKGCGNRKNWGKCERTQNRAQGGAKGKDNFGGHKTKGGGEDLKNKKQG